MDLILWRHAEAEDDAGSDLARRLTPRGECQAARMATWLLPQLGNSQESRCLWCVIASPAVRAQQTAAALGLPVETIGGIAPDAPVEAILDAAGWPDGSRNVIVVGHEPTLGLVGGALLNSAAGYVPFKKGAIRWFRISDRKSKVELVAMATPETVS
jgi:phosphohistidine phosphatase